MPEYNFYLSCDADQTAFTNGSDHQLYGGSWYQVYPGISKDSAILYRKDGKRYEEIFDGELWFINRTQDDYTMLSNIQSNSAEISLRVDQNISGSDISPFYEGYFSVIDGEWDSDRGIFRVKPSTDDEYRIFKELGDKTYNLYTLNPSGSVDIQVTSSSDIVTSGCTSQTRLEYETDYDPDGSPTGGTGPNDIWDLWKWVATLTESGQTYEGVDYWDCVSGSGDKVHVWRKESVTFDPGTSEWLDEGLDKYGNNYGTYSLDRSDAGAGTTQTVTVDFGTDRFLTMKDVLDYVVSEVSALSYKSTFFENDAYPSDWPGSAIGTENYVTGTDPNPLNDILITQKSNIKPTSNAATKWLLSFNDLMSILKDTFNVDWDIDADGHFRIEHVSYYTNSSDIDLTTLDSGKWINAKNKWSYNVEDMPNREHFEFMEAYNEDFIGEDIIYDRIATGNRYRDNQFDRVVPITTDVPYMQSSASEIANEGWALVTNDGSYIRLATGEISGKSVLNADLSWANLHANYWTYDRIIEQGSINGSNVTFDSYNKNIKQIEITYPEDSFDPTKDKITDLGQGEVDQASYKLLDGSVTVFFFMLT